MRVAARSVAPTSPSQLPSLERALYTKTHSALHKGVAVRKPSQEQADAVEYGPAVAAALQEYWNGTQLVCLCFWGLPLLISPISRQGYKYLQLPGVWALISLATRCFLLQFLSLGVHRR